MPAFKLTPLLAFKIFAGFIVSVLGMHYLNLGQKEKDVGIMVRGAMLVLLSLALFL